VTATKHTPFSRQTIAVVVATAALTALGSEAVKSWIPSLASYGWSWVARSQIVYVSVVYGEQANPVSGAEVSARSPDPNQKEAFATALTDKDGRATLATRGQKEILVTVSFQAGQKAHLISRVVVEVHYPLLISFGKELGPGETHQTSDLQTAGENITLPSVATGESISTPNDPRWLAIAIKEIGVKRFEGANSNPRIEEYNSSAGLGKASDKIPWGCSFVSWVFREANVDGNIRSARCADWLNFGSGIDEAKRGALAVLAPIVAEASSGFAGFVIEQDSKTVTVVVGNIDNQVTVKAFPKSYVRGYRWPH